MKYLFLLSIFFLSSCGISTNKYSALIAENNSLRITIDSLTNELNDVKFGSKNLLQEAKEKYSTNEYIQAQEVLTTLITKFPDSKEATPAKTLLQSIKPKAESQLFDAALKNKDVALLKNYISAYPKGRYYKKAASLIKQYQKNDASNNYQSTPTYKKVKKTNANKTYSSSANSGIRTGAICCDGSRSSATGRGACSHHGGVCEWVY